MTILLFTSKLQGSGVYVWRTRKPAAILGLPFFGRHFGYVGETTSIRHRMRQHVGIPLPGDEYPSIGQPWADLRPKLVLFIKLPRWKWLLRSMETLMILTFWPVYNDKKNKWNPRRIPMHVAIRQRAARNRRVNRWSLNIRPYHIFMVVLLACLAAYAVIR